MGFALFFLAEYSNIIMMASIITLLFFGGWHYFAFLSFLPNIFWLSIKILFFIFLFILVRATYPRYRYDQLMRLGWKIFLPISLAFFTMLASVWVLII
jgi:NADH-quinone oxidoreductase subunit H